MTWNLCWLGLRAAYLPRAIRSLGAGGVGLTLVSYGAGRVAAALAALQGLAALQFGRVVGAGAGAAYLLLGAGPILWTIRSTTLRQTVTPTAMLGRVSAIFLTVNMSARPLGAAVGSVVGEVWGAPACLWRALGGFGVQAVLIFRSPVRGLRRLL